jgi:hypothetical protein
MTNRIAPDNTSAYSPVEKLFASMDGGIEQMERAGQRQLVESTALPSDTRGHDAEFEALGFVFGEQVSGDPLFRETTLPEGWAKDGTDHAMHSVIKDERGIARVGVFYKAAHYDRRADMSLTNVGWRFVTEWVYGDETPEFNPLFTIGELQDIADAVVSQLAQIDECPAVYEKNRPRLDALKAAADAQLADRLQGGDQSER